MIQNELPNLEETVENIMNKYKIDMMRGKKYGYRISRIFK